MLVLALFKQLADSSHTSLVMTVGLFLPPPATLLVKTDVVFLLYTCRYAASIDDILEEEEHYADQIKEYLSYAEALR